MKRKSLFWAILAAIALTTCAGQPAKTTPPAQTPAAQPTTPSPAPTPVAPTQAATVTAGLADLDLAVREASNYLNNNLTAGSKLIILYIQSEYPALSEYIIDEFIANTVNDRVFSVVDRRQLDAIRAEMVFQMSGEVDDESAQRVGRMLGANTIISGAVSKIGEVYRLRVRALDVETARIEGQFNRNIPDCPAIAMLAGSVATGTGVVAPVATQAPTFAQTTTYTTHATHAEFAPQTQTPPITHGSSDGNSVAAYVFGVENSAAEELAEAVVNNLTAGRRYSAPRRGARQFFREVDRTQGAHNRGRLLSDRDFCRIGDDFGVNFLAIIDIERRGRTNSVWARILDLGSCQVIATAEYTGLVRNAHEIREAASALSSELFNGRVANRGSR